MDEWIDGQHGQYHNKIYLAYWAEKNYIRMLVIELQV